VATVDETEFTLPTPYPLAMTHCLFRGSKNWKIISDPTYSFKFVQRPVSKHNKTHQVSKYVGPKSEINIAYCTQLT